jgi:hypothetical protein
MNAVMDQALAMGQDPALLPQPMLHDVKLKVTEKKQKLLLKT